MEKEFINIRVAIDFDGTIVEHEYPDIGAEKLFAFETLREMQKRGFRLILWTYRTGKELEEALEFCRQRGVEFYAVNKSYPEEVYDETVSRKIDVDLFIDDKNIGGFPGWSQIWQMLNTDIQEDQKRAQKTFAGSNISLLQGLRKLFKRKKP
jgi:hypothetical protein